MLIAAATAYPAIGTAHASWCGHQYHSASRTAVARLCPPAFRDDTYAR